MKVLFLTNIPSPYRVDFFNELGKKCELTVLFESDSAKSRNSAWRADKIENFKAVFLKGIRVGEAEAFCPNVLQYLSRSKFDRIVVGMYSSPTGMLAIEYMKAKKIPFIISSDGGIKKDDTKFKYWIKRRYISAASLWLSTGKSTTEYLCSYGAKEDKVFVYPFTSVKKDDILKVPLSKEEKQDAKKSLGIQENRIVLSVGQFIYRKGYDLLLKNCKNLPKDIGIYIIGGVPTEEYQEIVDTLGLTNVHFLDFMTKRKLALYYCAADLFLLPTREDIWGLVINEAMSYGLPVLTTKNCVAGVEMIHGNGEIFDVDVNWGEKIIDFFVSEHIYNMSRESISIAQEYSIENMVDVHLEIFNKMEI